MARTETVRGYRGDEVTVTSVRLDRLYRLRTEDLINQYYLAISSNRGRYSNTGYGQARINWVVDLLTTRAEQGDSMADDWLMNN